MSPRAFHAIIVAAGSGSRSGMAQPKQFAPLGGRPLLLWSVAAFVAHPDCAGVVIVVPPDKDLHASAAALLEGQAATLVSGGTTRAESVAAGMAALPAGTALVLVHDAARPGLDEAVIDRLLDALADPSLAGAVPALPVADTLAQGDHRLGDTVARDGLWRVQTPQAFRVAALTRGHAGWRGDAATDDAQMVRAAGGAIAIVAGDARLDKITHPGDMARMTALLCPAPAWRHAVATGFDVHRLIPGDGVWLGGIRIAGDWALEGHSDADVLLHAITDALLGTIAAGDIGLHFPPSDPQWRGAASDRFLAHAAGLVAAAGGSIAHVDATVICERPKVGPHRQAIARRIADILKLPASRVSIKATTTERLGFTGRGEGIAVQAVASVTLPAEPMEPNR